MKQVAFFLFFCIVPVVAFAAGSSHTTHVISPLDKAFVYQVANFLVLIALLVLFLRKPAAAFFRKRSTQTRLDVEQAKLLYEQASKTFQEVDNRLKNADRAARDLVETIRREAESEKSHMLAQARQTVQKIKVDSEHLIQQELVKAREALKVETVQLATELAVKNIKTQMTVEDHSQLGDEFLAELSTLKGVS